MKLDIYLINLLAFSAKVSRYGEVVPTTCTGALVFLKDRKVFEVLTLLKSIIYSNTRKHRYICTFLLKARYCNKILIIERFYKRRQTGYIATY